MDFGEFSDVNLDTSDSSFFKSCDESLSEGIEDSGIWSNDTIPGYTSCDNLSGLTRAALSSHDAGLRPVDSEPAIRQDMSNMNLNAGHNSQTVLPTDAAVCGGAESSCSDVMSDSSSLRDETTDDSYATRNFSRYSRTNLRKQSSKSSIDELLFDLYDKHGVGTSRHNSVCSIDGSSTDCSSLSEFQLVKSDTEVGQSQHTLTSLQQCSMEELRNIAMDLSNKVAQKNTQLVKCLRNREKHRNRCSKHCDMITAVLQACSSKSRSDALMKFTIEPSSGDVSFDQWKRAIKALVRGPVGLPPHLRNTVWLALATRYIDSLQLDWNRVIQFAFNDKCNPDDDALGAQIVKDLHRTGCSSFSGIEREEDRVTLQRVLLAYARWNKVTGYCQGFNILAALILNVTNKNEADALKVMVYLVDHVLPKEYFAHNLRALTVDMAVFRNYLSMKLPKLSAHLVKLQQEARDDFTGACVEPPLTNVFTMQWFLTIFATCLPMSTLLRVWDCVLIDGNEILIRTALALWTKLAKKVIRCTTADEFYMTMGTLTHDLSEGKIISVEELIRAIYGMAPLPLPKFSELREKYMYDITPFSAAMNSASHKAVYSGDDGPDYLQELSHRTESKTNHSMDVALLKRQYSKLTQRQRQAKLLMKGPIASPSPKIIPSSATPIAINHLFVGKELTERNKEVAARRTKESRRSTSIDGIVRASTSSVSEPVSTKLDPYELTPQSQNIQCKRKIGSVKSTSTADSNRQEVSVMKDPKTNRQNDPTSIQRCLSDSDSSLYEEVVGHALNRQVSSSSMTSCTTTDSVFEHEVPSPSAANHSYSNNRGETHLSHKSLTEKKPRSHSVRGQREFNPFPVPSTGMLSAQKAKVGIKFGLYRPEDALPYVKPADKKSFIKSDKTLMSRMPVTSAMW
ncbi:TBC1 domain family member 30-like [Watersipora subatra]|uniref:TBC1 domain family member 30-like n=1 Tax=Watersipora subatra TaxID=2589382 RepID=UPI00355B6F75